MLPTGLEVCGLPIYDLTALMHLLRCNCTTLPLACSNRRSDNVRLYFDIAGNRRRPTRSSWTPTRSRRGSDVVRAWLWVPARGKAATEAEGG